MMPHQFGEDTVQAHLGKHDEVGFLRILRQSVRPKSVLPRETNQGSE